MNRWIGTGHLTKDPKFLETESGTAICTPVSYTHLTLPTTPYV